MARYRVSLVARPENWQPVEPDDVPAQPGQPLETLGETEAFWDAVRQVIEFNQQARRESGRRWAVVVEPGSLGKTWPGARLCTPLAYKVTSVWWPAGWEPESPSDAPRCVWRAQSASGTERLTYRQALVRVHALNQQAMDRAASLWYVIMAVENEPLSWSVSFDPSGTETTVEVRRVHLVRPEESGGGSCWHCPARAFECAKKPWRTLAEELSTTASRSIAG